MLGAIVGDIAGSTYEFLSNKNFSVPLFPRGSDYTDDTIMTVATAAAILAKRDYRRAYLDFGNRYPDPMGGYGAGFKGWLHDIEPAPYGSWGNGSAMRVSPVGWAFEQMPEVLIEAKRSAEVTHSHPEGIKGAQAVAATILMARGGSSKAEIRSFVCETFGYDLSRSVDEVRDNYAFNESCQRTVPEAIIAFLGSDDFEHAIRNAISLGGDADTVGCITGAVAHAYYGEVPPLFVAETKSRLPNEFLSIVSEFTSKFGGKA